MKLAMGVLALVASVVGEAAPGFYYGHLGYLGYGHYYGGCHNVHGLAVPCAGRKRREAEAAPEAEAEAAPAPEADPTVLYSHYGYLSYPLVYSSACHNAWGLPVPCAGRKRREAEAEAAPEADPGLLVHPGFLYAPVVHTAAAVVHAGEPLPHGVAFTPFGAVHSSHIGHCVNNEGEKVDC